MTDTLSRRALLGIGGCCIWALAPPLSCARRTCRSMRARRGFETAPRNVMGFRNHHWKDHFKSLRKGAILCDTYSRALHYWSEDARTYLVHPCSVPMSEEFTKRGYTKSRSSGSSRPGYRRRPCASVIRPCPRVSRGDPRNPLGSRALNLGWRYYRIHGIDNPAKIGRRASNGCFGMLNPHAENLFELVEIGTQVRVI